jgi:prepilin-type N-terminal cleavage/methylation domain-containing protein
MKKRNAFTLVEFLVVIAIIGVLFALAGDFYNFFKFFVFGWFWGLCHLFYGLEHEPIAVLCGFVAFLLLPITLHFFVAPIAKRHDKIWTFRKSCLTSFIIVALAGAGLAIISGIHEVVWLLHPKEPLVNVSGGTRDMRSYNNLKQLSIAVQNYSETYEQQLPFGSTVLENGQLGHGWITQLLPFCEQQSVYEKIDMTKSWNDPQNAPVFKEQLNGIFKSSYFDPQDEQIDRNGFAKTDYSANQFVLPVGRSLKMDEITDGLSNTVLFGEITQNLPAWGSPLNGRDLRLGINSSPYGFGSKRYRGGGGQFVHCDGSVKFYSKTTDPKILEALANPANGQ